MAEEETTTEETTSEEETTEETTTESTPPEEQDWKAHSRKHEREAKKARAERDAIAARLKEREDADKTDQEKALEQAREEAAAAARTETSQAYRDRLLKAEVRAQAAGKFANPALAFKLIDLDHNDVFDADGEIDASAIGKAIDDFLAQEPSLKAGAGRGSSDAGRGSGGSKDLASMTVEEHLARQQAKK